MKPWILLAAAALLPAQDTTPTFRTDVQLVSLPLTVRDAQGRLVTGLTRDDFDVFEDGERQPVSFFAPSAGLPLSLGLIFDGSGSQEDFSRKHRRDLRDFLKSVMTPAAGDQAFLVGFGNRIRLLTDFAANGDTLLAALEDYNKGRTRGMSLLGPPDERRSAGTAFYDAIYYAVKEKLSAPDQRRKGIVMFSDGEDNSSAHHLLDAIEAAQSAGVPVFCIRYIDADDGRLTARNKYGISVMNRLALETGAADFDAVTGNMQDAFAAIRDQLKSSYELSYASTHPDRDGTFRKVVIRPRQPGLKVRHKTGYYAR
jgi:Ca-activated chloride channel family protein